MAKRYDPILCMLVDEPAKAKDANKYVEQAIKWMKEGKDRLEILFGLQQMGLTPTDAAKYYAEAMTETGYKYRQKDAMPSDLKKAGYEVGTVEKYGSTYYTLVYNGKVISTSPTEANIVEKAKKHYANRHDKAQDAGFVLRHKNGQYMSSAGRTNEKAKAKVFSSKREAEAYKGDYVVSSTDPDYHDWSVVAVDSASALDKAIKTCAASKADMDYWVGRYEKGCKSLIDAIKQGRSPIKTVQKAKQVISQDYDSHWKYLKDAFASYVVSTAKEEAKGDLSGMIDNTSKVEKREWKEFADREKKLMKAKNDALKSVEQAFK